MKFQCRIKELLIRRNMRQYQLAQRIYLGNTQVSRICCGDCMPHPKIIERITRVLEASTEEVWPNYAADIAARNKMQIAQLERARRLQAKHRAQVSRRKYDLKKSISDRRIDIHDADVVPLADDAHAQPLTLRAGAAKNASLANPAWCHKKAGDLHKYLVRNCAWGVYCQLRQIMADENRLAELRRTAGEQQ